MMGENFASVMVDVGISDKIKGVPRDLAVITLHYKHPDDRGLPTNAEFDAVIGVENLLENFVAFGHDAYVGRITKQGRRHFFIYTKREASRWNTLVDQMIEKSGYAIDVSLEEDPQHETYWKYLYPTPDDWRVIHDMSVCEQLAKSGDDPSIERRIDHWVYFPDATSAQPFVDWAVKEGFSHDADLSGPDDNGRYCVRLHHVGPARQRAISNRTIALRRQADELGGEYDGWETSVERGTTASGT